MERFLNTDEKLLILLQNDFSFRVKSYAVIDFEADRIKISDKKRKDIIVSHHYLSS